MKKATEQLNNTKLVKDNMKENKVIVVNFKKEGNNK